MDVVYRIYLANNLQDLVEPLTSKGMEVHLMASDSLEASPLWRLLALEESGKIVTLASVGGLGTLLPDLQRTEQAQRAKLAGWRVVPPQDFNEDGECVYHPIDSRRSGWVTTMPVRDWLKAFYYLTDKKMIKPQIDFPGCGVKKFANGNWLQSSYADWFLSCVAYPRLSADGVLTFLATSSSSALAAL